MMASISLSFKISPMYNHLISKFGLLKTLKTRAMVMFWKCADISIPFRKTVWLVYNFYPLVSFWKLSIKMIKIQRKSEKESSIELFSTKTLGMKMTHLWNLTFSLKDCFLNSCSLILKKQNRKKLITMCLHFRSLSMLMEKTHCCNSFALSSHLTRVNNTHIRTITGKLIKVIYGPLSMSITMTSNVYLLKM